MPHPPVDLVPLAPLDPALPAALAADLRAAGYPAAAAPPVALDPRWRDPRTGRVRSQEVIHTLLDRADDGRWRLAMVDAGLCGGPAGEVLGEAAFGERCAVIGIRPLRQGSGADEDVLRGRILTTALHELGHLAGAEHCRRASCVMYSSGDIADTDRKGTSFCQDCGPIVKRGGKRKS